MKLRNRSHAATPGYVGLAPDPSLLEPGAFLLSRILSPLPRYTPSMFTDSRRLPQKPQPPPTGRVERVGLVEWSDNLRPYCYQIGTIEGCIGDDVLVRFGEIVLQVPAEMLVGVDE